MQALETIDDDLDHHGLQLIKSDFNNAQARYGVKKVPALVYFEKQQPLVYQGDLTEEDEVLEWLKEQSQVEEEIEDVTHDALDEIIKTGKSIAVIICKNFQFIYKET